MIYIYIEDQENIKTSVINYFNNVVKVLKVKDIPNLEVVNFPSNDRDFSVENIIFQIKEIFCKYPENTQFSLFSDYGIKTGPNNEDYHYVTSILNEFFNVHSEENKKIKKIVIYSYQLGIHYNFYNDIDSFEEKCPKNIKVIDFETSLIFNKRTGSKLYNKNELGIWTLKNSLISHYSILIAKTLLEFVGIEKPNGVSLLSNSTRKFNRYIYFMNVYYFNKQTRIEQPSIKQKFILSFISFINPKEIDSKYGGDAPYKPYYKDINDYIEKKDLTSVYKSNTNDYYSGLNYVYFRVYKESYNKQLNKIKLYVYTQSHNDILLNNKLIPTYFNKTGVLNSEQLLFFWIKVTYYSVYHQDFESFGNGNFIDFLNKNVDVQLLNLKESDDKSSESFTEYIWYFHKVKLQSFGYSGLLNYAFHREFNEQEIHPVDPLTVAEIAKNLYNERRPLIESNIFNTLYPYFNERLREHSLLNALSTVLNRNGSHNLGSHVLAALSNKDLIDNFLNNQRGKTVLYTPQYYFPLNKDKLTEEEIKNNKKSKILEYQNTESLIAYFNAYLKNRLDLLAAVGTSGEAVMLNNKPLFAGVFKNFERNLILLQHISGKSSDFTYKFNLITGDSSIKDVEVAMPNDLLGDQALYLLLENVIRNTAKHGIYSGEVEFTINVNTKESNNNFYAIELWDNNCLQERFNAEKQNRKEDDEFNEIANIIEETNHRIDKDILKEDFNIREGGWGTIEMKIACCYLSGLSLKNIDDDAYRTDAVNNRLPIIQAFEKKIPLKKSHLGYRFYIQKPKSVLVIDLEDQFKNDKEKVNALKEKGIDILSDEKLKKALEKNEIFKHQFIVGFAKKETAKIIKALNEWFDNKQLPNRCLFISDKDLINKNLLDACCQQELAKVNPFNKSSEKEKYLINVKNDFTYCIPDNYTNDKFLRLKNSGRINFNFEGKFDHHKKTDLSSKIIYCEPYGSISSLGVFLQDINNPFKKNKIYFNLLDAIRTKVLVVDERVQNALENKFKLDQDGGSSILFEEIYKATNIVVPSKKNNGKKLNLNKPQDYIENIKEYIEEQISNNKIDFFVFHFGILEKIIPNGNKKEFKEYLELCRNFSTHPIKIILTSGRGIPSDLPNDEYFCNFSSINHYLTDSNGRSKVHLTQLLRNQRTK